MSNRDFIFRCRFLEMSQPSSTEAALGASIHSSIRSLPRFTLVICLLQILLYSLGLIMRLFVMTGPTDMAWAGLALYPGLITYFWTLLTASLFQTNILELAGSLLFTASVGKYFEEKVWGEREFLRFTAICAAVPTLGTLLVYMSWFVASQDAYYLYRVPVYGIGGLLGAFAVAFKQVIPEHTIHLFQGLISIRVKRLPVLLNCVSLALALLIQATISPFLMTAFGSLTGWVYLRFYKLHDGLRGDRSEAFAFLSFFPDFTHWLLKPLSDFVYGLALIVRLVPPVVASSAMTAAATGQDLESNGKADVRRTNNPELLEAERRRALALRALEERLLTQQHQHPRQSSAPPAETKSAIIASTTTARPAAQQE